jgi:predicted secreted Zn-dependent protease
VATATYTIVAGADGAVSPTVHALRNEIRLAVGRYERVESTGFTKEALAAICEAVGADIDTDPTPATGAMRTAIRQRIDDLDAVERDGDRQFRKAELRAIAETLREA